MKMIVLKLTDSSVYLDLGSYFNRFKEGVHMFDEVPDHGFRFGDSSVESIYVRT